MNNTKKLIRSYRRFKRVHKKQLFIIKLTFKPTSEEISRFFKWYSLLCKEMIEKWEEEDDSNNIEYFIQELKYRNAYIRKPRFGIIV